MDDKSIVEMAVLAGEIMLRSARRRTVWKIR